MLQKLKARYGFQCCTGSCLKHSKLAPGSVVELGGKRITPASQGGVRLRRLGNMLMMPSAIKNIFIIFACRKHHFQHCDAKLMLIILRSK